MYWATVVAIHLWAVPWARNRSYLLPLIAVIAALPGLIVLLSALAHSRRMWVTAIVVYLSLLIAAALIVAWHVGDLAKTSSVVYTLGAFHAVPILGVLILMQRRLRSLLVALVAVLLFLMAGIAGMSLASGALGFDRGVVDSLRTAEMRWPLPAMLAMGAAGFAIGVWIFLRLLRSRRRLPLVSLLAAMLVAGPILDSVFQPAVSTWSSTIYCASQCPAMSDRLALLQEPCRFPSEALAAIAGPPASSGLGIPRLVFILHRFRRFLCRSFRLHADATRICLVRRRFRRLFCDYALAAKTGVETPPRRAPEEACSASCIRSL